MMLSQRQGQGAPVRARAVRVVRFAALLAGAISCSGNGRTSREPPAQPSARLPASPNAHPEIVEQFKRDRAAKPHPSDGAGRAWIADSEGTSAPAASTAGRFTIVYEAGPLGVEPGGIVSFRVSPFWGWSRPQITAQEVPGFTTVRTTAQTTAQGVALLPDTLTQFEVNVRIAGRALRGGEQITFTYGAGPMGAFADRYSERNSRFWIWVDGNGDGIRRVLADSPGVDVGPGPPAMLLLTLPTTARPGESVRLAASFLDRAGNAGVAVEGDLEFNAVPEGIEVPERIRFNRSDNGLKSVQVSVKSAGVYWLSAVGPGGLSARSNPLVVGDDLPRVRWADLQIHSGLSDGTGLPEDVYTYARDAACLDAAAITDHDHWGMLFVDEHDRLWDELKEQARRFNEPGRFVTLLGYEWTSWIHGHRHVLYPGDQGDVYSSIDDAYQDPEALWDALRGTGALTIAHHTAGAPVATNWTIPPDPELETVCEIVSAHGSGEASDSPLTLPGAIEGNYIRDALDRGYRLGFIGSGDGHDGHPGLAHIGAPTGGLAAILTEDLTRRGILDALRARRVYATSGARVYLQVTLNGLPMGSVVPAPLKRAVLKLDVVAPTGIERIDLVRSGEVVKRYPGQGKRVLALEQEIHSLEPSEYLYLRVVQTERGLAWSSPFFFEKDPRG